VFDKSVVIDAGTVEPTVTWGTSPEDTVAIGGVVPDPASFADPSKQKAARASLDYMGLEPGQRMVDVEVQNVFIGSCTNSRIEDLRAAAEVLRGRRKAPGVKWAIVVPGSGLVKQQAEAEGLDKVFTDAGLEWREPGCSACLGMNPDKVPPGERCASTSKPQLRRPPGPWRADASGQPGDGGRGGGDGQADRRARACRLIRERTRSRPVVAPDTRLLVLGSLPGEKSLAGAAVLRTSAEPLLALDKQGHRHRAGTARLRGPAALRCSRRRSGCGTRSLPPIAPAASMPRSAGPSTIRSPSSPPRCPSSAPSGSTAAPQRRSACRSSPTPASP
jgi:hypothetical protein